jgi:DNA-binding transcriptional MocR family regulator
MIRLDRLAAEPLHQQLYRQIRDELINGNFNNSSSRLPSSRALAADLGISRLTVTSPSRSTRKAIFGPKLIRHFRRGSASRDFLKPLQAKTAPAD